MKHRVLINGKSVNVFDTKDDAYDFAISLETDEILMNECGGKKGDVVKFDDEDGFPMTTDEYNMDYNED